jgi:GDP-4-dehydro-6-deoxy-D-mannose reductase
MRVLVTGADGFVGRYLVRRLVEAGHAVGAAVRPGGAGVSWDVPVTALALELTDERSVRGVLEFGPGAVVHLAAVASTREARRDPAAAWTVNAAGTARLAEALADRRVAGGGDPLFLLVSSAEVYGSGPPSPRLETDALLPQSTYAASKVGAEVAALECRRRTGLRTVVARPFTHTGPGQRSEFVLPAFATRLRAARTGGARGVPTGNLDPVRDILDVRDVADAYVALIEKGTPGEIYNVARGEGVTLREVFARLARLLGIDAEPLPDPGLSRALDIPWLVGDPGKLHRATGWTPSISLDDTLRGLLDAQTD